MTRRKTGDALALGGELWLTIGGEPLGGRGRIALLAALAEHGSITRAAQAVGLSYKAAWEAIDTMNAQAARPLVARVTGGRGGGSTRLTDAGRQLVERFALLEQVHRRFVRLLSDEAAEPGRDFDLLKVINMRTSARNQYLGTVSGLRAGAVNDEVELTLPGGTRIVAMVSRGGTEGLGLSSGASAFALIEASAVTLAVDLAGARLSARNQLPGRVVSVTPGAVNAEVELVLSGGERLAAIVTMASVQALDLAPGRAVTAVFKAGSVILGTLA